MPIDDFRRFIMGDMADFAFDQMNWDEHLSNYTKCKYCHNNDLHWIKTEHGWRLADQDDKIHNCSEYEKK